MSKRLSLITLLCFVGGIAFGIIYPAGAVAINGLGTVYINALKIMIIPVLFFSILSAILNSGDNVGKTTYKTVLLFIEMFIISFLIIFGLSCLIKPGVGFKFTPVAWDGEIKALSFNQFLLDLIPNNIIAAASNNSILPVILFTFFFGLALKKYRDKNGVIQEYTNSLNKAVNQLLQWIMYFTPIGVFSLISNTVATYGTATLKAALTYILCAWIGSIIILLLVMILPVWVRCHISPLQYIKKAYRIWIMTLSTRSSAATLPSTIRVCNEEFNIPPEITNIVVPLGCTIHMCGGAVSFALLATFNMQMYNIPLTIGLFITMLVSALLINMGAPGIPGGGIVIGATYLSILGVPLDFIGFYAGIYTILDMIYTTMNVTGDITANCLIKKSLE